MSKTLDISTVEIDGINLSDYPDFVDAYVSYAEWDDGTALTEAELDKLNSEPSDGIYEIIQEAAVDAIAMAGDAALDAAKEGLWKY